MKSFLSLDHYMNWLNCNHNLSFPVAMCRLGIWRGCRAVSSGTLPSWCYEAGLLPLLLRGWDPGRPRWSSPPGQTRSPGGTTHTGGWSPEGQLYSIIYIYIKHQTISDTVTLCLKIIPWQHQHLATLCNAPGARVTHTLMRTWCELVPLCMLPWWLEMTTWLSKW